MISLLESLMYEVSNTFLPPVLILIVLLFLYSVFQIGIFLAQTLQRRKYKSCYLECVKKDTHKEILKGYPIIKYLLKNGFSSIEDLEIFTHKKLENTSLITRVAPMLGLVATMIPMGPALKDLSNGNIQGISENLAIAFAAVIFALMTASITYWITTVRRRWYAHEIKDIMEMNKI